MTNIKPDGMLRPPAHVSAEDVAHVMGRANRYIEFTIPDWERIEGRTLRRGQTGLVRIPEVRVEHTDPRDRLLMLYGVWVKCLPHQAGKRALVERCISRCKAAIEAKALDREWQRGLISVDEARRLTDGWLDVEVES